MLSICFWIIYFSLSIWLPGYSKIGFCFFGFIVLLDLSRLLTYSISIMDPISDSSRENLLESASIPLANGIVSLL